MTKKLHLEMFPGYMDPEGRPWETTRKLGTISKPYQTMLEAIVKSSFLTQQRLVIPIGYLFDNPAFQAVLLNNLISKIGNDFSQLLRSTAVFMIQEPPTAQLDSPDVLRDTLRRWLGVDGDDWRGTLVAPNNIAPDSFDDLKGTAPENAPEKFMDLAESYSGVSWRTLFDVIAHAAPRVSYAATGSYRFHEHLLREVSDKDSAEFTNLPDGVCEKILAISELKGKRLSRSLIRNHSACREYGLSDKYLVTSQEYQAHLLAPCRHLQQYSFSELFGSEFLCGDRATDHRSAPHPSSDVIDDVEAQILGHEAKSPARRWFSAAPGLQAISYADIRRLRETNEFQDSLRTIGSCHDAAERQAALHAHWGIVAKRLWRDAGSGFVEKLGSNLFNDSFSISGSPGAKVTLQVAICGLTLGAPIWAVARKHRQLRVMIRSSDQIKPTSPTSKSSA